MAESRAPPRLLTTVASAPETTSAIDAALPGVPWGYAVDVPEPERGAVEALLVGSFARDPGRYDSASLPRLRFVQRLYTGIDGFPFDRIGAAVEVAGNVGAFAPYVSEHAVALALATARDFPRAQAMVAAGTLRPAPVQRALYGSTCLILGYGEIGQAIGHRAAGFGATIVGLNRSGAIAPGADRMYSADRLHEALGEADFVFEVRPLTARTRGSLGAAEFAAMRPKAVFVNVGRAATVDEEALYRHLLAHPEFRAATDVWWEESYSEGRLGQRFPLSTLPNFVGTPHSAGFAPGADARALAMALENLARFFRDGRPEHVIDRSEYVSP